MLLGLRGVGKTVLLKTIQKMAEDAGHFTSSIESPEDESLGILLYPAISQVLRRLSLSQNAKDKAISALRALRSFASVFNITIGDASMSVDPEPGAADSGRLENDLTELFIKTGEAAQAAGKAWTLLIDEVQYLNQKDLAALIVAIHKINQDNLPILFFGAGLPQTAALAGNAKSYAERLFLYPRVDALNKEDAKTAIKQPIEAEKESITDGALDEIYDKTKGYPYFLQEWGHQSWVAAKQSPISKDDVIVATDEATRKLDDGFFKVRFDRLTPKEREYVIAMAKLGEGPYRSSDVAEKLNESQQGLGTRRASLIGKGMIYSPSHGDIAFTVPSFNEYLIRNFS
jgi:hypothetical protein